MHARILLLGNNDENEVDATLMCAVHRNEHNFIAFILDLMTKNNKINCECDADQPSSSSLTSGHRVGIGHFLTEDKFIQSLQVKVYHIEEKVLSIIARRSKANLAD